MMKFLKYILATTLSLFLLTAVLPSTDIETTQEPIGVTIKKSKDKLIALTDRKKDIKAPSNG